MFLHITKCMGKSIREVVDKHDNLDTIATDINREFHIHTDKDGFGKKVTPTAFKKAFKFTFIREPFDRFISAYEGFVYRGYEGSLDKFIAMAEKAQAGGWGMLPVHTTKTIKNGDWWITEEAMITHIIPYSLDGSLKQMDFVGKYKFGKENWKYICKKLGIKDALPHNNASNLNTAYTNKQREQIEKIYQKDIDEYDLYG